MDENYYMRLMTFQTGDLFRSTGTIDILDTAAHIQTFTSTNGHYYSMTELLTDLNAWVATKLDVILTFAAVDSSGVAATDTTFDHFTVITTDPFQAQTITFTGDFRYLFSQFSVFTVDPGHNLVAEDFGLQSPYRIQFIKLISENFDGCNYCQ